MTTINWNITPKKAIELQKELRQKIELTPLTKQPTIIAGFDVSVNRFETTGYAGFVVFSYPDLVILEEKSATAELTFPYIPGLLSFREIPILLEAWKKVTIIPDLLVADGQGIAHPRRLGIATHLGLILDIPTIGCAKSILTGVHEELPTTKGSTTPLFDRYTHEIIGTLVRSKDNVKPLIISPGHKITIEESVALITSCIKKHRLPEPTRLAHEYVNRVRRGES